MKRVLFLAHRWMGVLLCLFMAMWFVSGVVMMYVGYPKLTPSERRAGLPALGAQAGLSDLATALQAVGRRDAPESARLSIVAGTPRLVLSWTRGQTIAVDARSGRPIAGVGEAQALRAVRAYAGAAALQHRGLVDEDAWTHSRALDPHRPLHLIEADDGPGTRYYVSSTTGEVVRDATRAERGWNWIGAWIHWLYPFRGGMFDGLWTEIVIYAALIATVLSVSGVVVGLMRWRFAGQYRHGGKTPYLGRAMRWHHLLGLAFGAVCVTWIFSGLLSMNPWQVFDGGKGRDRAALRTGLDPGRFTLPPAQAIARLLDAQFIPVELEWRMFDGRGQYVATDARGQARVVPAHVDGRPIAAIDESALLAEARRVMPGVPIARSTWLREYDAYYYARAEHTMSGSNDRRLPVLRIEFADQKHTWLHLDPATGAVASRLDDSARVRRWLFAFLHSWDWPALLAHRPWWDALLIVLSLGGAALSLTGVAIGWRRLGKKLGGKSRAVAMPAGSRTGV